MALAALGPVAPSPLTWRAKCQSSPGGFHASIPIDEREVSRQSFPVRRLWRRYVVEEVHVATRRCAYCAGERVEVRRQTRRAR